MRGNYSIDQAKGARLSRVMAAYLLIDTPLSCKLSRHPFVKNVNLTGIKYANLIFDMFKHPP